MKKIQVISKMIDIVIKPKACYAVKTKKSSLPIISKNGLGDKNDFY
jgi:hypothetical protein